MGSLLVVLVVAGLAFIWVRGTRRNRQRWLTRLDLPGAWSWEGHDGVLEFGGGLSEGAYRRREPGCEESGTWLLTGHLLELTPEAGPPERYDLRFFDDGKIGLARVGGEARIYVKTSTNVVPLRRGKG